MPESTFGIDESKLIEDIDHKINEFEGKRLRDKRKSYYFAMVTGFASATTTALIGLGSYFPDAANIFYIPALLVSASLTIVTAWDNLYRHKDLWIMNVKARNNFYNLKEDIEHAKRTKTLDQNQLKTFFQRYRDTLSESSRSWEAMRNR